MTRNQIVDNEVALLAAISGTLKADYIEAESDWLGSPFEWIRTRPSRQVGAIGEQLVAGYFAAKNLNVVRSPDSDADRIVEGVRTEIKFSTRWRNGNYKFQQLRNQNYEVAVCLGVSPFDAHCWVIPKQFLMEQWGRVPGLISQHGGSEGRDTAWLDVNPSKPHPWLQQFGGRLRESVNYFRAQPTE